MSYVDSMHYVSTTTISVDPTPIECDPTTLMPPPKDLFFNKKCVDGSRFTKSDYLVLFDRKFLIDPT